jgi:hypothetical protein
MRRANPQLLLLVFAMNIVITAAVVLFATRGIRDTAVFLGILATLVEQPYAGLPAAPPGPRTVALPA